MIFATLFSKALGLLRSMISAWTLGDSAEAVAFAAASKIPGALFDLIFAAAILACFIPAYNRTKAENKSAAKEFSSAFFGTVLLLSAVISVFGVIFAPEIISFSAPKLPAETAALSARLLRMIFPMTVFTAGVYTLTGILQSAGAFLLPASVSAISNAFISAYLLLAGNSFSVYALAAVYVFSWFLQFLTLAFPLFLKKQMPRPKIDFRNKNLRACFAGVPKIMAGSLLSPALLFITAFFASFVSESAFLIYDYASGIYTIVSGIAVYGVGNFVFPKLSALFGGGRREKAQNELSRALFAVIAVSLPVFAAVFSLASDGILLLYGRGNFSDELVYSCASALKILSFSTPAYAVAEILLRAFYADGKNAVPMYASFPSIAVCIVSNAVSLALGGGLGGICISFAAAVWTQAVCLIFFAAKNFPSAFCVKRMRKAALLFPAFALCMGAMIFLAQKTTFFASFPETIATFLKISIVFTGGTVIYLMCIYILEGFRPTEEKR